MGTEVFIVVGGIGALTLVLAMVFDGFDDLFDGLDAGEGVLSLTAIGSGMLIFGAGGFIAAGLGLPGAAGLVLGAVLGVGTWLGIARVIRAMRRSSSAGITHSDLVGVAGTTTARTGPEHGEVRLDGRHGVRLARTFGEELAADSRITVLSMEGSRVVVARDTTPQDDPPPRT